MDEVIVGLTAIVVLAVGAQALAARLRLPSIVVLLAAGMLVGPVAGLVDPDELLGAGLFPAVSLAVGVILFDGGLLLNFRELGGASGRVVRRLLSVGLVITWLAGSLVARYVLGFEPGPAAVLGAMLTVSGPTVVLPLLGFIRPSGSVASILKFEGVFIDGIGAALSVLVFEAVLAGEGRPALLLTAGEVLLTLAVGAALGALGAAILVLLLRSAWVADSLEPALTLAAVLAAFTVADELRNEAGLFAATVMGVVLANQTIVSVRRIAEFKEVLGTLLTGVLFIVLSSRLSLDDLGSVGLTGVAFIVILILAVRPVAVLAATAVTRLGWRERALLGWMAPRGIVAAATASIFAFELAEAGVEGTERLAPVTFAVILGTAAVYGFTGGPLARRLELAAAGPGAVLVAGATPVGRRMAASLRSLGAEVVVVTSSPEDAASARAQGIDVRELNLLKKATSQELDLNQFSHALVVDGSDERNSLLALHLAEAMGRRAVHQLSLPNGDGEASGSDEAHLRGEPLFGPGPDNERLEASLIDGARLYRLNVGPGGHLPPPPPGSSYHPLFIRSPEGTLTIGGSGSGGKGRRVGPGDTAIAVIEQTR